MMRIAENRVLIKKDLPDWGSKKRRVTPSFFISVYIDVSPRKKHDCF